MSPLKLVNTQKAVALNELEDAWTDFLFSRKAMLVAETTLRTYRYTAGKFVEWLYKKINSLDEIRAFHVRAFLSELREMNLSDHYIHCNARAIKTFLRFLFAENYICEQVTFQMPTIAKKRLPILSPSELKQVLNSCHSLRDKAIVMLMDKSGIHVSPHILRRTFAALSLRAGMSPLHLQGLLGHTTLEMVRRYAQMVDDDFLEAHNQYGPIDRFLK